MRHFVSLLSFVFVIFFSGCYEDSSPSSTKSSQPKEPEPKEIETPPLPPEPYFYQQWYINYDKVFFQENYIDRDAHIHIEDYLDRYSGKGIKIAVIDDGLDIYHEDLSGAIYATYNIQTGGTDVAHLNSTDIHGTAVTGIIAARKNEIGIQGIAYNADIIFLRHASKMSDSQTIQLFNKAQELGADIINCSWGTENVSQAVKEKIQDLAINGRGGKGIPVVFSIGNDSVQLPNDESSIPEVIAVGATDEENLRTYYSNFGPNLHVMAPGGYFWGITTLDPMHDMGRGTIDQNYLVYNDTNAFTGTSAAAPIVSAVIALMLEKNPNLTVNEIKEILKVTSDKVSLNVPYVDGRNDYYGYGKINLAKIMEYLKQ